MSRSTSSKAIKETREELSVDELMGQIRSDVTSALRGKKSLATLHGRLGADTGSSDLDYLNKNYNYPISATNSEDVKSHRAFVGTLVDKSKRAVLSLLRDRIFNRYFAREAEYESHLVRTLNDINARLRRLEEQRGGEVSPRGEVLAVRDRVDSLEASNHRMTHELEVLDSVTKGIERIVANLGTKSGYQVDGVSSSDELPDYRYLLLENRFRGSEEKIAEALSFYVDFFSQQDKPVLEIGAGRGEVQESFSRRGISSYGIELDQAMVERCKEKGLNVRLGDGLAHLEELEDESLGGVLAIQVVEHLGPKVLDRLLRLCASKVAKGGRVVFETINTGSIVALSHNYFRDPTHAPPMHPDTLVYAMELAGMRVLELRKLSAFPDGAMLQEIRPSKEASPELRQLANSLNHNISQLNSLLYGHQDYCVVAEIV